MKKINSYVLLLSWYLFLTSCVPMIRTVYKTPRVSGTVFDLASMQPLQGVVVSHLDYDDIKVVTDEEGHFTLSSVADMEFVMLMDMLCRRIR